MNWPNIVLGAVAGGLGGAVHQLIQRRTGKPLLAKIVAGLVVGFVAVVGHALVVVPFERREAVARVDEDLRKLPAFQALRDADPSAYAELEASIEAGVAQGLSTSAIVRLVREKTSAAMLPFVPEASDGDVIAFFESVMAQVREIKAHDSAVAFGFLFPLPGEAVDTKPYVAEETTKQMLDSVAAVIRSGAAHSASSPDVVRAKSLLQGVVTPLMAAHGPGLKAMAAPHAPGVDKQAVLEATVAMYEGVLQLPAEDAALVLRYMAASSGKH